MSAPSLIAEGESLWTNIGGTLTSPSVSWLAGDIITVLAGAEGPDTINTPTATGLTFTVKGSNIAAGTCGTMVAAATAASDGSSVITVTNVTTTHHWGFAVWVWRGSAGIGSAFEQHTSALSNSFTAAAADSAIVWGVFDFSASALQTIIPTPTDTRQRVKDGTSYTLYVADLVDQASAGAVAYGISGSATGPLSIIGLEILASGGGGGSSPVVATVAIAGSRPFPYAPSAARRR